MRRRWVGNKTNTFSGFRIKYRFYTKKEGGGERVPHQGCRSDLWYANTQHKIVHEVSSSDSTMPVYILMTKAEPNDDHHALHLTILYRRIPAADPEKPYE